MDISRTHARDLDRRPWWHRAALENEPQARSERSRILRREYSRIEPQTDRQLAQMTANYYGEIAFIDHGVGRILGRLEELGLAGNTLVLFTADHGELLGDHGLYLKGPTPYEGLLRVGLIAKGPGVQAGRVVADPVSTVDLAATFYDYAGIDCPDDIQSRSLKPLLDGRDSRDVRLQRVEPASQPRRRRASASDGANRECQADGGPAVRGGRDVRPRERSGRDGKTFSTTPAARVFVAS